MVEALKFLGKSFYFLIDSKHESFSIIIFCSKVDYSTHFDISVPAVRFFYFTKVGIVFLQSKLQPTGHTFSVFKFLFNVIWARKTRGYW